MRPAQELVNEWMEADLKAPQGFRTLVRAARVELLEELLRPRCKDIRRKAEEMFKEARTK